MDAQKTKIRKSKPNTKESHNAPGESKRGKQDQKRITKTTTKHFNKVAVSTYLQ